MRIESNMKKEQEPNQRLVRVVKISRNLKTKLTDDELRKLGDQAAFLSADIDAKEAEKKSFNSQVKADLDEMKARHKNLSQRVREQAEYRQIDCQEVHNLELGMVTVIRLDTAEELSCRAMSAAERANSTLPGFEPKPITEDDDDEGDPDDLYAEGFTVGGIAPPKKKASKKKTSKRK